MRLWSVLASLTALCLLWSGNTVAAQTWRGLRVAPKSRCSPYLASDYSYPQSIEAQNVESLGGIWSPYTGRTFSSRRDTDIEHIVARSEAHDSGLCAATPETRRRFATDLLNLTLASPDVNRGQKNDRDAAAWVPDRNPCWFADRVVRVRQKYSLTIDRREANALDQVLVSCASTTLVRGGVPKGNRTYVDATTQRKSAGCGVNSVRLHCRQQVVSGISWLQAAGSSTRVMSVTALSTKCNRIRSPGLRLRSIDSGPTRAVATCPSGSSASV